MKITGKTKVVGIFGDPVAHSLSPAMHNAAFDALGIDMVYVPFHVRPDKGGLEKAVYGVRAMNIAGVNITIPHKEKVMEFLDEVNPVAGVIGAVNTVVNDDGRLVGYNTDARGYSESLLEDAGLGFAGKNIIIIGAGGGARSVYYTCLFDNPKSVTIANRTIKRAETLAQEFRLKFKKVRINVVPLANEQIKEYALSADLLINTTSVGMGVAPLAGVAPPAMDKGTLDIDVSALPPHAVVSDIVYAPLETDLIRRAKARGLKTHTGLSMLVHQGAVAFELWTGSKAPVEIMRKAAIEALNK